MFEKNAFRGSVILTAALGAVMIAVNSFAALSFIGGRGIMGIEMTAVPFVQLTPEDVREDKAVQITNGEDGAVVMSFGSRTDYINDELGNKISATSFDLETGARHTVTYDSFGNKLSEISYDEDGAVIGRVISEYDERGNLTSRTVYDENGEVTYATSYDNTTYYYEGSKVYSETFTGDGASVTHYFDRNGNMISNRMVDTDTGELYFSYRYTYDDNGNILTNTELDADGAPVQTVLYTRDDKGNELTRTFYDADGNAETTYITEYDGSGYPVKITAYTGGGEIANYISVYINDGEGRRLSDTTYENGVVSGKTAYTYDAQGNKTGETLYGADGAVIYQNTFTYDIYGHLLSSTQR